MMKIVTYPDSILTAINQEVSFPLSREVKQLILQMWETVKDQGVGLAAPQVGANLKLCIIHMAKDGPGKKNAGKDFVMINPEIVYLSDMEALMTEGCLSFPEEYYDIWRPQAVTVKYQDEKGRVKKMTVSGWAARVIQHEVDHLNGQLFINLGGTKLKVEEIDPANIID